MPVSPCCTKTVSTALAVALTLTMSAQSSAEPKASAAADAGGSEGFPPLEVEVRGPTHAPGATSLDRAEVRLLPGAFGDPFRAVEAMPGVTPLASGLPYFYVRGAPPGNVGYFLDGIRVPLLFHIGLGPSVIHPAIIDRVDLYSGGYPARFGRFAGGVVAGELKEPPPAPDEDGSPFHGEANVRLVDSGAMLEGPIGDHGTFLAAGRYSYTGALLSAISSSLSLGYWDYQARATYSTSPRDSWALFSFGAYDFLGQKDSGGDHTAFDTTFHRVDLRYGHRFGGADDRVRHAVTLGWDKTGFDKGAYARELSLSSRSDITYRPSCDALLRFGIDGEIGSYSAALASAFDSSASGFTSLFGNRVDTTFGARADAVLTLSPAFEITPGVRVDVFESQGMADVAVDPRIAARLAILPTLRLVQAHGLASQPPSFVLPGPGFQQGLRGGLQRSFQSSIGVEADLPLDLSGSLVVFRNAFFNMTDTLGTSPAATGLSSFPSDFTRRSLGSSVGVELFLRRRLTRRLGGFVSYTLSRSERTFGRTTVASAFDRTHVLATALGYDFGAGYRAGGRFTFYTGYPNLVVVDTRSYDVREGQRLLPFYRVDVRLEKRWKLKSGWLSLVLEVQNVTLNSEALGQTCKLFACTTNYIGPVTVPSLGLEGGF